MSAQPEDLIIGFIAAFNDADADAVDRYIASDFFTYHPAADEPTATERWRGLLDDFRMAMPDMRITVDDLVSADEDHAACTVRVAGTHTAGLWGAPASENRVEWETPISVRRRGDRIAVRFDEVDLVELIGLLRQFGLVNPPDEMHLPVKHPVVIDDFLAKVLFTGQAGDMECAHLEGIAVTEPATDVCESCVASDDVWPALRLCLTCGHVGCCDTSTNRHAFAHYTETGHPLMRSIRMDEGWMWCYADNAFFEKRTFEKYR
jgi:predicted ester cyclase